MIKSLSYRITPASFMVLVNGRSDLVTSMVLSTVQVLAILTVAPWLAPILMADVQNSFV
jgi:hypothetical protein